MAKNIAISLPKTGEEEWQATKACFTSGWLTQGPKVAEFEKKFAKRHQVGHAVATTSCTTGLHLILAAMGIGVGNEVIVPAFTWIATANVVLYCGAKPILVDVDPKTYNIDPAQISQHITKRTKAIIVVHLFGLCADIHAIKKALPFDIPIVEDAAGAAGATYHNTPAGGLGLVAAFSFHPRKSITTGEGGMVTTNHQELAQKIDQLRNHGASISEEQRHHGPRPYLLPEFNLLGFNYRMTDIQGAVGLVQLSKLDAFISDRQQWAEYYCKALSDIDWLVMPYFPENATHALQAFVTSVDPQKAPMPRNKIMEYLQEKGISTRPGTHAVHMLEFYRDRFGFKDNDYPGAQYCHHNTMAIPLHNQMTQEDYHYIVNTLKEI